MAPGEPGRGLRGGGLLSAGTAGRNGHKRAGERRSGARAAALALAGCAIASGCAGVDPGSGGDPVPPGPSIVALPAASAIPEEAGGSVAAGMTGVPPRGGAGGAGSAGQTGRAGSAEATATSALPGLQRLTNPGCCPLPFWSADGRTVLYWDRPDGAQAGVYGVPAAGGQARRVAEKPAGVLLGGRFSTVREGDEVVLTRTRDDRRWRVRTEGASLVVSPDGRQVAWVVTQGDAVPGAEPPARVHWRATLDDLEPERVEVPPAYALSDWTAAGAWLLARVDRRRADLPALVRFEVDTGDWKPLMEGERLRTFRVSPGRTWLAVSRVFEADAAVNGLYVLAADGTSAPRRLDLVGGYQWRDDGRLLVVPMEPGAASMSIWQVDAVSGRAERLTDPARAPFRVAAGEWSVAPGGAHVAFRSADDDALWVIALP